MLGCLVSHRCKEYSNSVSGSGLGHGTPDFDALSERSNYRRESQSTVAGPPSCASVALVRRLGDNIISRLADDTVNTACI